MSMHIPAMAEDINSVMMVGSFMSIRIPVMTGTRRSQGDKLNFCANVSANRAVCS